MKEKVYFYVCDRKMCVPCDNYDCNHTSNIKHAVYDTHTDFDKYEIVKDGNKADGYFEKMKGEISN